MTSFSARIIRTAGLAGELPTTQISFVLADALKDAYAAFLKAFPDCLIEFVDHEPGARLLAMLKPGVPTRIASAKLSLR